MAKRFVNIFNKKTNKSGSVIHHYCGVSHDKSQINGHLKLMLGSLKGYVFITYECNKMYLLYINFNSSKWI